MYSTITCISLGIEALLNSIYVCHVRLPLDREKINYLNVETIFNSYLIKMNVSMTDQVVLLSP